MKKKLLVVCPYPQGVAPSQRLKFEQYFECFQENGWEIVVEPFINIKFWNIIYEKGKFFKKLLYTVSSYLRRFRLLFKIRNYDAVYVHLWVTPFGPPFFESVVRRRARRLIYDIDDLVYLRNTKSRAHPLVTVVKGRRKPIYLMKHAWHVITCTPYLDEFVRQYNSHTTDISSTVDTDTRYKPVNKYCDSEIATIGWSGSISTSKYFYLLTSAIKKLAKTHQFKLVTMGDPKINIDGLNIESLPWEESSEIETLQRFDIGVYPLPNEQWVYGKSGLKAIQYMALGIPTVATAIGANFRVIENGVSGFLVGSDEEWVAALSKLLDDAELRKRIGLNARKRVEENFSVKANKQKYLDILNGTI